jgi:hypothetical protein
LRSFIFPQYCINVEVEEDFEVQFVDVNSNLTTLHFRVCAGRVLVDGATVFAQLRKAARFGKIARVVSK